jgi:hypothetical protein
LPVFYPNAWKRAPMLNRLCTRLSHWVHLLLHKKEPVRNTPWMILQSSETNTRFLRFLCKSLAGIIYKLQKKLKKNVIGFESL